MFRAKAELRLSGKERDWKGKVELRIRSVAQHQGTGSRDQV